jgi:DNA-binding transcriptional MerR regulator
MSEQDITKPLLQSDIADALGTRASTIKYYTQLGLLPYTSGGTRMSRYYTIEQVKPVLAEIEQLKAQGSKMADIVRLYAEQGKLASDTDITMLNLTKLNTQASK